ncbi:MAG: FkbM family methyltransferase [Gammaproteobacteria bacterium AqS3]|nr:FkbM family methyltransferase [Gammaproteobacteria bacterium AqS3]
MPKILSELKDTCSAVCETRDGRMVYSTNDLLVGRSLEKYGEYARAKLDLLRQICQPGAVAVDVGAFNGAITLALAKSAGEQGRVIAYEACHTFFQQLCGTLALNGISNTHTVHAIVGEAAGHQFMLDPVMNAESLQNLAWFNVEHWRDLDASSGGQPVRVVALDDVVDVPHLNLIKISAANMEAQVVRGATELLKKFNPVLYVDVNSPVASKALIESLWERSYRCYWSVYQLFNPDNFNSDSENFLIDEKGTVVTLASVLAVPSQAPMTIQGMDEILDATAHPLYPAAAS